MVVCVPTCLANLLMSALAENADVEVVRFARGWIDWVARRWVEVYAEDLCLLTLIHPGRSRGA